MYPAGDHNLMPLNNSPQFWKQTLSIHAAVHEPAVPGGVSYDTNQAHALSTSSSHTNVNSQMQVEAQSYANLMDQIQSNTYFLVHSEAGTDNVPINSTFLQGLVLNILMAPFNRLHTIQRP